MKVLKMNRAQKTAWFIVINFSVAIIVSLTAYLILFPKFGASRAVPLALSFLGLCGFSGFAPIIFKKDPGHVVCDERDIMINRRAAIAGFGSAFLFVGLACMLPFTLMGSEANISVNWLPGIFCGAGIISSYMHAITILVMYGKGDDSHE